MEICIQIFAPNKNSLFSMLMKVKRKGLNFQPIFNDH